MNATQLLAEAMDNTPFLGDLRWEIKGDTAWTDLSWLLMDESRLVDALPIVNALHAAGWKRDGRVDQGYAWALRAELSQDGATLRLEGITSTPPANGRDAIPYFADVPPDLPRRMNKRFEAEYREWERKCLEAAW